MCVRRAVKSDPTAKETRAMPKTVHLLNLQRLSTASLWFICMGSFSFVRFCEQASNRKTGLLSSIRIRPPTQSLVPQRDQRIDAYREPRRNITSKQRDTDEKKGDARECQRICRPHAVKQSCH